MAILMATFGALTFEPTEHRPSRKLNLAYHPGLEGGKSVIDNMGFGDRRKELGGILTAAEYAQVLAAHGQERTLVDHRGETWPLALLEDYAAEELDEVPGRVEYRVSMTFVER